ncbi:hypothetical protein N0B31_12535 [Salinirubellus salinus]|jgi:hypothetical protein|uniref:Uncharacterized protein n=1 Tax=Salinirubellus salinus TaxID=1364945 RepID=A0A9E7QZN3_9EURY|nr:hypothetical protein [Salinirubellus salinus]UWM52976.1 hypothetical protein N0B31_12535 [Salinirubellus salinus]
MSREDEEGVLGPEELDIERSERAARLSDGRFVIAADADESPDPPDPAEMGDPPAAGDGPAGTSALERVQDADTAHGFVVAARFGDASSETSVFADDLGQVFRSLLLWYAAGVDPSSPPEEVLGVLLRASGLTVRYPPGTLARLVAAHDLTPEDDIADLLAAVSEEGVNVE